MSDIDPAPARTTRATLPSGSATIGVGLLIGGVSIYVFFRLGQDALGTAGFKPITSLWFVLFALVPGFLLPIEQEISRAIAHRRALGDGIGPVLRRVAPLVIGITIALLVIVALLARPLTNDLFEGSTVVTIGLFVALLAYAPFYFARGVCSGKGHFRTYSAMIALDGALRVVGAAALLIIGVARPGPYALMVALTPLVIVAVVAASGQLSSGPGTPATWSELAPNLGWLLFGSLFAAALVNAGPLTVDILGTTAPPDAVTRFGNAVLLARVPLFLFQAVQAAMLPRLTRLATLGDAGEFRDVLRRLIILVGSVGVLGVGGAFAVGPWVLELVYGGGIDRRTLTLLALSSAIYMLAQAFAQSVLAMSGHRMVALGWTMSFAVFVATAAWSSSDLYLRVEIALLSSAATAFVFFGLRLRSYLLRLASRSRS